MHIVMLSWEYPPRVVGGLAHHVRELARALVEEGNTVQVITAAENNTPVREVMEGVTVRRILPYHGHPPNFLSWVQQFNLAMLEEGASLCRRGQVDLVHAHDWLAAYAGRGLKHIFHLPLIATIHATEFGRNNGLHSPEQRYISEVEWMLTYEAWRVICCSQFMREEIMEVFSLPADKITVIPNGVRPEAFRAEALDQRVRSRFASPHEKLLFFIGRLVPEKGVQVLIQALPALLQQTGALRLVVAGCGPYREDLVNLARALGVDGQVHFAGYVDEETRNQLYAHADAAVFPSLYEPFGLVALEAMAAGTPVAVGAAGGFLETVRHEVNGLHFRPGDPADLAYQVGRLLQNPAFGQGLARRATQHIEERFSWSIIARQTEELYQRVVYSGEARRWRRELDRPETIPAAAETGVAAGAAAPAGSGAAGKTAAARAAEIPSRYAPAGEPLAHAPGSPAEEALRRPGQAAGEKPCARGGRAK